MLKKHFTLICQLISLTEETLKIEIDKKKKKILMMQTAKKTKCVNLSDHMDEIDQ